MSVRSLGMYTMNNSTFYENSNGALLTYMDEQYVSLEEFNHLRYLLGVWQGQYYKLSSRVGELELQLMDMNKREGV